MRKRNRPSNSMKRKRKTLSDANMFFRYQNFWSVFLCVCADGSSDISSSHSSSLSVMHIAPSFVLADWQSWASFVYNQIAYREFGVLGGWIESAEGRRQRGKCDKKKIPGLCPKRDVVAVVVDYATRHSNNIILGLVSLRSFATIQFPKSCVDN